MGADGGGRWGEDGVYYESKNGRRKGATQDAIWGGTFQAEGTDGRKSLKRH